MTVTEIGILHQEQDRLLKTFPGAALGNLLDFVENELPDGSIGDALSEDETDLWEDLKRVQSWMDAWADNPVVYAELKRQLEGQENDQ